MLKDGVVLVVISLTNQKVACSSHAGRTTNLKLLNSFSKPTAAFAMLASAGVLKAGNVAESAVRTLLTAV
jgi:hypothetical protein